MPGIERAKAERVASVIFDAIRDNVATKADVQGMQCDSGSRIREENAPCHALAPARSRSPAS